MTSKEKRAILRNGTWAAQALKSHAEDIEKTVKKLASHGGTEGEFTTFRIELTDWLAILGKE